MRDEKLHAAVARSTCGSENVKSTSASEHFWKLTYSKSTHRCGAKHILKSKCQKHHMSGPLLELEMLKKCTLLWCEACFQVKMRKAHHGQSTFGSWDVGKVHADVARSTFPSQNGKSTACSFGAWCRKSGRRCDAKRASKSKVLKTDGLGRLVGCCCPWQVQWVLHLVKSELNVEVLHFACQSSWSEMLWSSEGAGLHFRLSDLEGF